MRLIKEDESPIASQKDSYGLNSNLGTQPANINPKPPRRLLMAVLILVIAAGLGAAIWQLQSSPGDNSSTGSHPNRLRLIATGDFIAHDSLNQQSQTAGGGYDYLQFMSDFKSVFSRADVRFCNQATVSAGESFGISGYPIFNAPIQFAKDMGRLGCNLIGDASNHSFDKGQAAIDATLNTWDSVPDLFAVAGENRSTAEQDQIRYFDLKGIKFAILAYTTYSNVVPATSYGVNVFDDQFAKNQIEKARAGGAQIVIVSMRWGTEYSPDINDEQTRDSQFLADQGVDLILGHGPHVIEPVKLLKGAKGNQTLVWYSLGNFINTQEPPETLFNGLAVIDFDTKTKRLMNFSYLPIYMHYEWTASEKAADDLLSRHNLHLYLLDDANQALIDANQLATTVQAQRERISRTLNTYVKLPIISKAQYFQ